MTGLEDIVWQAWVRPAAPHLFRCSEPARPHLARSATQTVIARFAHRDALMDAMTSALRRAVTTGIVHLQTDGPRIDIRRECEITRPATWSRRMRKVHGPTA